MGNFISWLWSGFGTGVTALRAFGMALIVVLFGFIVLYYIIKGILNLFTKNKTQTQP